VNITYPGMVIGPPVGDRFGEAGEGVKSALRIHAIPGRSAAWSGKHGDMFAALRNAAD
jgi:dihydroflavonol-4-reductase